jgi:secondary thiamine-phosphate synthase enzyme
MIRVDSVVREVIERSRVQEGLCVLWVPHTTAAMTVNENADPHVMRDILSETEKIIPFEDGYLHSEGNSAAHIKSSLFGPSLTVIIHRGSLLLGTWQSLFFCEFDGPRSRKMIIKLVEG